jgi:formylglycine-generating enzyme required for sulfatase activity
MIEIQSFGPNNFEAKMHLIDAFATFNPIDIRVLIETIADNDEHSLVCIQVSHQPVGHDIWRSLGAAIESIRFQTELLGALKKRTDYASLDKQSVEALARIAQARWPNEFNGFRYQRVERFSAGGVSHWMSIWLHDKTGLEFVLVPGGKFQMGSPASEAGRREDEIQHWVTLDPFLVARTECTQEAWVKTDGSKGGDRNDGSGHLPVSGFSPADVDTWCDTMGLMLPTEAQWEYMCRAGTKTPWAMGADKTDLVRFGNVGSAECPENWIEMGLTESWRDGYGIEPAEVGMFKPNAFGLFDVHGNLSEWVRDDYYSYEVSVESNSGTRAGTSKDRIARGGNGGGAAVHSRSAYRLNVGSGVSPGGNKGFGFRPSLDLPF